MKKITLLLLLAMFSTVNAQEILYSSSNTIESTQNITATKITKDANGNSIIVGTFIGQVDFDFSAAINNVISEGANLNTFILKLSASGNFVWVKTFSGSTTNASITISDIIVNSTNIYITGNFSGTVDFDPSSVILNKSVVAGSFSNTSDFYMGKYDLDLNPIWVQNSGSTANDVINSFALDANGSLHAVGTFSGTADFDPGSGSTTLTPSGTGGGRYDGFYWKLGADGSFLKAFKLGGIYYDDARKIIVDSSNILIMGVFSDTVDFDPSVTINNMSSSSGTDTYVLKLDLNHSFLSSIKIGSEAIDFKRDSSGNLFLVGLNSSQYEDFDPSSATVFVAASSTSKLFILKLNSSYTFNWVKTFASSAYANSEFMDFEIDSADNLYTLGRFKNIADFDPGVATYNLGMSNNAYFQTFIQKLNNDGNFVYAGILQADGSDYEFAYDMYVTSSAITMVGSISSSLYVDPNSTNVILYNTAGQKDAFIVNLNQTTLNIENFYQSKISIYPNPATSQINLLFEKSLENANIKIISMNGQVISQKQNISGLDFNMDVSRLNSGMYLIQISDKNAVWNSKFIKQ